MRHALMIATATTLAVLGAVACAPDPNEAPTPAAATADAPGDDGEDPDTTTREPAGPAPEDAPSPMAAVELVQLTGLRLPDEAGVLDLDVEVVDAARGTSTRRVRVHRPAGDGPFPLVVALHPFGSSGSAFDEATSLGVEGTQRGAVVLLPDGIEGAWNASLTCCQPAIDDDRNDVGFVAALIEAARRDPAIRDERARVTGFSNGGYLAYRLACRASDLVGAVAVMAGTMDEPCLPANPVSVLHLHGEDDLVVPFEDTRSPHSPQAASRGALDVAAAWAELDGCTQPTPQQDRTRWECPPDTRVEFVAIPGLAHRWSPRAPSATAAVLDFLLHP